MSIRLLALGLFSAALFLIELGLTRLFATRFYPPFVFVVLSIAILGLGLGAALATWQPTLRRLASLPGYAAGVALGTILIIGVLSSGIPIIILLPLTTLPFLFAGLLLATLFSHHATASPRLYLADLVGAGCGALLATPLFAWVGVWQSLAIAVTLLVLAGILFHVILDERLDQPQRKRAGVILLLCLSGGIALGGTRWFSPDPQQLFAQKPIAERLASGGEIVATNWDGFARTDLVNPGAGLPYELYLDGAAGSVMPPAAGHDSLWRDIGFFPFATEQPERIFVIGPGGGLDLWFGLQSGAAAIVAVEVNPASVALMQAYRTYNGNLVDQDPVRLVMGEGRAVLSREGRFYDLIFLSQVVTLAAERSGYALVENTTYTMEAFATYLSHLRPQGMVALKLYDEATLTRALATILAILRTYGLADHEALQHVIVLLDPQHDPPIPLVMVRNEPFARNDVLSIGAVANEVGFQPFFLPGLWAEAPLDAVASGEKSFDAVIQAANNTTVNFVPTTDNRPFFFLFERGIPQQLQPLLWAMVILSLVGIILVAITQSGTMARDKYGYTFYFAMLGLGFILVEITLIQQTQRFLGHPTTAITAVLAILLLGAGLGSGLAGRWLQSGSDELLPRWPLVGILLWLALWLLFWPQLSLYFESYSLPWRIGTLICYLLPLAMLMGMPFALGLRAVHRLGTNQIALAWAANGVASVVGALIAITVAITWGYYVVALLGWLCYLGALTWTIIKHNPFFSEEHDRFA